uniref:Glycosyl transferase n=1 Tax=Desulfacinum infernum TaxID=35837 RepID=A0A832EE95_9BACT
MGWHDVALYGGMALGMGFGMTLAAVPMVRRWAFRLKMVAAPREDRWHAHPTPLLGGLAIGMALWGAFLTLWALGGLEDHWRKIGGLTILSSVLGLVGLVDDRKHLAPQTKLLVQIVLASFVVFLGFEVQWFVSKTANRFWSILWVVAITNAFNLLDNMDGLSAGVAAIACAFLILVEAVCGHPFQPIHLAVMALLGALAGFLVYNFHPASIFMGDCGSLPIGFFLAAASTQTNMAQNGPLVPILAVPVFIFCLPLFDMAFVSVMRPLFGRSISTGGRDHTSHRLVAIGLSERNTVLFLYGFSTLGGILALFMALQPVGTLPGIVVFLLLTLFLAVHLARVRTYGPGQKSIVERNGTLTVLWIQWTYKKRMFEVLLDVFMVAFAYWVSYFLRYEKPMYESVFPNFLKSLPLTVACCLGANLVVGIYRGVWRLTSTSDLVYHLGAASLGVALTVLSLVFLYDFEGFSRSIFGIFWALWLVALSGSRVSFCFMSELLKKVSRRNGRRVAIYGADERGSMILYRVLNGSEHVLCPVGFIDNDEKKQNARIYGYKVIGPWHRLEELIRTHRLDEILVPVEEAARLPFPAPEALGRQVVFRQVDLRIG